MTTILELEIKLLFIGYSFSRFVPFQFFIILSNSKQKLENYQNIDWEKEKKKIVIGY